MGILEQCKRTRATVTLSAHISFSMSVTFHVLYSRKQFGGKFNGVRPDVRCVQAQRALSSRQILLVGRNPSRGSLRAVFNA